MKSRTIVRLAKADVVCYNFSMTNIAETLLSSLRFETDLSKQIRAALQAGNLPNPDDIADLSRQLAQQQSYGRCPSPGQYDIRGVVCGSAFIFKRCLWYGWIRCRDDQNRNWYGKLSLTNVLDPPAKNGDVLYGSWQVVLYYRNDNRPELCQLKPLSGVVLNPDANFQIHPRTLLSCEPEALTPGNTRREREHAPPLPNDKATLELLRKRGKKRPSLLEIFEAAL